MKTIPFPPPPPKVHPSKGTGCMVVLFLTVLVIFVGCQTEKNRKYTLVVSSGHGFWNNVKSTVHCDSFQMNNSKNAVIWIDGEMTSIYADDYIIFAQ